MFKRNKASMAILMCVSAAAATSSANAANYYLKQVSTGKYATINTSNDRIELTANSTSAAQVFTKVSSGSGYKIKAVGGSYDGQYSDEPSGGSRQEVGASSSSAEVFSETACGDGGVYLKSSTTNKNLKVESNLGLGNGSSGNCSSSANKFEWVEAASSSSDALFLQHVASGKFYTTNSSDQLISSATSTSGAQAFEKVSYGGGYVFKAVGGDLDGFYSDEPSGANRQELSTLSISNAEVFFEYDCGNDVVYFTSATTGGNLKNESNSMLGNGSGGSCGSSANEFKWVTGSTSGGGSGDSGSTNDLDPNAAPSTNFDLSQWNLGIPVDRGDGISTTIKVADLNDNYENNEFFYTASDGGMVFKCPIEGPKTSSNTSYTRSELREMLRGTDTSIKTKGITKNNWVFDNTSIDTQLAAGGVGGNMKATLKVDHVTTTGNTSQQGRVIIGQIHAPSNEPIRLYYRKLAHHNKGSIYFAHEPASGYGNEQWVEMIGSKSSSASEPSDGIALGEVFSYEIDVTGTTLKVTIKRDGKSDLTETLDMSGSGYHLDDKYQYFKAGVYNQNNTGDADDYVQATFYHLEQSHN